MCDFRQLCRQTQRIKSNCRRLRGSLIFNMWTIVLNSKWIDIFWKWKKNALFSIFDSIFACVLFALLFSVQMRTVWWEVLWQCSGALMNFVRLFIESTMKLKIDTGLTKSTMGSPALSLEMLNGFHYLNVSWFQEQVMGHKYCVYLTEIQFHNYRRHSVVPFDKKNIYTN